MKNIILFIGVITGAVMISGCVTKYPLPSEFTGATKIVKERVTLNPPKAVIKASFDYHPDPAIVAAYKAFVKSGEANPVSTKGFIAYPFDTGAQPILVCQPLKCLDMELEPGEFVKGVNFGDTYNWTYDTLYSGTGKDTVEHVIIKPKALNVATNAIITTNRRAYHVGLISKAGLEVKRVKFWYPLELEKKWQRYADAGTNTQADNGDNSNAITSVPNLNINKINFEYTMSGDDPSWKPIRIFDDGVHTYLQFPSDIGSGEMPILYVYKNDETQMMNYRVKGKYFITDGVYSHMVLILGKKGYFYNLIGDRQDVVYITNERMVG